MIILDTNVVSALMRPVYNVAVVKWTNAQRTELLWTTAVCIFELRSGILLLPGGKRREGLSVGLEEVLSKYLSARVLTFDQVAAEHAASLDAARIRRGFNVGTHDAQIAGIALAHGATLATCNTRHFEDAGVRLMNPWAEAA